MAVETCDVAVLGLGGMGSAAAFHVAARGMRVIGIEQYGPAHALGSSHGDVRVIRKGYFEHPDYVPLLHRAYALWEELEARTAQTLLTFTGALFTGTPGASFIAGLESCYRENALPHERLGCVEMRSRFTKLSIPEDHVGFYDPFGAYLFVEKCVQAHLDAAAEAGASLYFNERVLHWTPQSSGISLTTERRTIHAAKLVVAAGPWAGQMLSDIGVPLTVERKAQVWMRCPEPLAYRPPDFPIYLIDRPYGTFYGFPDYGGPGLKIAEHTGGAPIADPVGIDRALHASDTAPIDRFIAECLPGLAPDFVKHSICMYTCTPDGDFVLDRHPAHPQVVVACGFSGHGFKFASVVGEIMADLALTGSTNHPIGFLRCQRGFPA